jgi:hypothetical protein
MMCKYKKKEEGAELGIEYKNKKKTVNNDTVIEPSLSATNSPSLDNLLAYASNGNFKWVSSAGVVSEPINVKENGLVGDNSTNDSTALDVLITSLVGSDKPTIYFPKGNYVLNGTSTFPFDVTLIVEGTLKGTGKIVVEDGLTLYGGGTISILNSGGQSILHTGGNLFVNNITFRDNIASTTPLQIQPAEDIEYVSVTNCHFKNLVFGILRQGGAGTGSGDFAIKNCIVANNTFEQFRGDAIQWNVDNVSKNLLITNNVIRDVNGVGTSNNWGMGIGIASENYDVNYENRITEVVISNNTLCNMRQAIHFEGVSNFRVTNNVIENVSDTFAPTTGLEIAGIVTYGCSNFIIDGNLLIDFEKTGGDVVNGIYTATGGTTPCIDYIIKNNMLINAQQTRSFSAGAGTYVTIKDNELLEGSTLEHYGTSARLSIIGNTINSLDTTVGFKIDYDSADGRVSPYRTGERRMIEVFDNTVRNQHNVPYTTFLNISAESIESYNNNFQFDYTTSNKVRANRTFYCDGQIPYGVEFLKGDIIIDYSTPARYLVTTGGSLNRSSDNYTVVDAGNGVIESTGNIPWTSFASGGHHELGQAITLSNGGGSGVPLDVHVSRVYIGNSKYRMELDQAIPSAIDGTITATNTLVTATI